MRRAWLVLVVAAAAAYAGDYDLLICHCDPGSTSGVMTNIGGYPGYDSVDVVDCTTQTPSVATMENYGCIYTWSNYAYQDATGMGDNLADYMDEGIGGVVSCCFAHYSSPGWGLGGRYANDADYCPVTMGGVYYSTTSLGSKDDTSPVIDGEAGFVSSINNICCGEYIYVESPATWIADCANGYILAAVNAWENAVGINLYPGDYHEWTGDGWILYNNAICFLMPGDGQDLDPPYVDGVYPEGGDYNPDDDVVFHCIDDQSNIEIDSIDFTLEDDVVGGGRSVRIAAGLPISPTVILPGHLYIDDTDPKDVVCTFDPDDQFYYDRWYTATVDGCLADIRGNEMGEDFVWEFWGSDVKEATWGAVKAEF